MHKYICSIKIMYNHCLHYDSVEDMYLIKCEYKNFNENWVTFMSKG